jgi:transcriptional regulator with XRE-family HTH domain
MRRTYALRELRRLRGLTQVELAARAGVDQSTISSFETGPANPTPETVRAIARALNVSPSALRLPAAVQRPHRSEVA